MKPLALTMGDGAGVGPELVLAAAASLGPRAVIFGSAHVLAAALEALRARGVTLPLPARLVTLESARDAAALGPGQAGVVAVGELPPLRSVTAAAYPWGHAVPAFGRLQYDALVAAIDAARRGDVSAIVTAPWHKARLGDAGLPPTGHTEVLAAFGGAARVVMLLAGPILRVALATTHLPLRDVAASLDAHELVEQLVVIHDGLRRDYGIASPSIAVCGLNPHAGEDGVLGDEEARVIRPAIAAARDRGVDAWGPVPADTLFPRVAAGRARADAIVAMYHDQGLGPLKTLHFGEAANITLGLPFVRTSVDHGTAYDIAGTGLVDRASMDYAVALALDMAARRAAPADG